MNDLSPFAGEARRRMREQLDIRTDHQKLRDAIDAHMRARVALSRYTNNPHIPVAEATFARVEAEYFDSKVRLEDALEQIVNSGFATPGPDWISAEKIMEAMNA